MTDRKYMRSDLADEMHDAVCANGTAPEGVIFHTERRGEIFAARLTVENDRGAALIGKPVGRYVTLSFSAPQYFSETESAELSLMIGDELFALMRGKNVDFSSGPVLIVGLGNRRLAVDAAGPAIASKVTVTSHLQRIDAALFSEIGQRSAAAFCPGVLGDTGIETADSVQALCGKIGPCAVIVADALAAGSRTRLARAVQLSDAGISPGSGVGNDRRALNSETLGPPVFAVGIPTVVDLRTLVTEALNDAGAVSDGLPPTLEKELEAEKDFFVAPKDIDAAMEALSTVIAAGIDSALSAGR